MANSILSILPVLVHRVGLILSIIAIVILVIIPYIYPNDDDQEFAVKLSKLVNFLLFFGLLTLFISGSIRLLSGIPSGFPIKAISALSTLLWALFRPPVLSTINYKRNTTILLLLFLTTAVIGIFL